MSIELCQSCGRTVDTDIDPESYLLTTDSIGKPRFVQTFVCICLQCRIAMSDEEVESRTPT